MTKGDARVPIGPSRGGGRAVIAAVAMLGGGLPPLPLPRVREVTPQHLVEHAVSKAASKRARKRAARLEREGRAPGVHLVSYASQPDIRIDCTRAWTTPAWSDADTDIEGVYRADDRSLYTFDREHVTCPKCRELLPPPSEPSGIWYPSGVPTQEEHLAWLAGYLRGRAFRRAEGNEDTAREGAQRET